MRLLLLLALVLLSQPGGAQIYKTTDAQGNVSYSDMPPAIGPSEQIELRQTNSAPPPEMPESGEASTATGQVAAAGASYSISIASPADQTTIPMGPGNVSISATVDPALDQGALLQLFVDGTPYGNPQSSSDWELTNVFRGAHDLSATVVDTLGNRLGESATVRVYVLRPSVNFKNRN